MEYMFNKFINAKLVLASLLVIQLVACGGGGGGGESSSGASTDQTVLPSQEADPSADATTANASTTARAVRSSSFTIGGTVIGLRSGSSLKLADNSKDSLLIAANGAFKFANSVARNGSYLVTVLAQPTGQICTVSNGSGSGVVANITNVTVTCSTTTYSIAGNVAGLTSGQSVTLLNNGANSQIISANGAYTLSVPVAYNSSYSVTVGQQPTGQICSVSNGSGSGVVANVNQVNVTCSTTAYTISGAASGLAAGQQVTLLNNGADPQIVSENTSFNFATPIAYNGSYSVTIGTQPAGQSCSVSNGAGSGVVANVNTVNVTCSSLNYNVTGSVTGLNTGQQVTLLNSGSDPVTVTSNSIFAFSAPVVYNGSYAVTVGTQPIGQTCTVSNGAGSGVVANVVNVSVSCSNLTYTIAGSVAGLNAGQQVTLVNNGSNAKTMTANGTYTFSTPVAYNSSYAVTISTQPVGQVCSVSNGTGTGVVANVANANVNCSTNTYTVAGSVKGLASGAQVTLLNNGANPQTVTSNAGFTFTTPVAYGGNYAVTIGTQPVGQSCTVSNSSGAGMSTNVSNVSVNCVTNSNLILSPYMYYGDYNDSSYRLMTALTVTYPTTQTMVSVMPAKLTTATWAFASGTCGSETWSGTSAAQFANANVANFVAAGKKYIVSTGGSGNNFLCASASDFIKFIQTYYSANMVGVDFDIENTQTQADVNNLVQVVVAAQATYPNLRFSFTVGSTGGNVPTLDYFGTYVLNAIKAYGLKNYTINLMVMDYTASGHESASVCTLAAGTNLCEMGLSAIAAAQNLHNYWGVPYNQIELTPMIGGNDSYDEVFTIADAGTVSSFALANNLAGIHFWGFSRDKDCAASTKDYTASDRCNNYGQAGTLGFTNAFLTGLGY